MKLNALYFPSSFPAIVLLLPIMWPREQAAAWRVGHHRDVTGAFFSWAVMGGNKSVAGKPANDFFQSRWDRCPPRSTSLRFLEITNQALPDCISICKYIHAYIYTYMHTYIHILVCMYTVDSHSQIPYLRICLRARISLWPPQINTQQLHGHLWKS